MKKKILILSALMLSAAIIFSKDLAFAKASPKAEKEVKVKEVKVVENAVQTRTAEENNGMVAAIKEKVGQLTTSKEEKLQAIEEKKVERQEKLQEAQEKKEQMKEQIQEKKLEQRSDVAAKHTINMEKRFSFYSERLDSMISKFQGKLDLMTESGLDTALAQEKLNAAADQLVIAIEQANTAITEFAAIEPADFASQQELSKAAQAAAKTARDSYKAVHMKLVEALEIMEELMGVEEEAEVEEIEVEETE